MSTDGHRIKWRRNIAKNFNRLSRVHERYRQTDGQTDRRAIAYSERERDVKNIALIRILTMRYCSVSMITSTSCRSAYLWNSDLSSRALLAARHLIIGCSCMWSPIRMILATFGENPTKGISVSGSVHMALSSTIIYREVCTSNSLAVSYWLEHCHVQRLSECV